MESSNIYPFFFECAEKTKSSYFRRYFNGLAFGKGGHIIIRKNKHILITPSDEFIIPKKYSISEHHNVEKLLQIDPDFKKMLSQIKESRSSWLTIRKKDKLNLVYAYIASTNLDLKDKLELANVLILAIFLKLINLSDISYDGTKITSISNRLTSSELYKMFSSNEDVNASCIND